MASQYTKVKKFAGVYYSESTVNFFRGKPEKTYWINFRDFRTKKLHWKRCGRASEGWTPESAQRFRFEQIEKDRAGLYKSGTQEKAESVTLNEFFYNNYVPWTKQNQRRPIDDLSRYNNWIKEDIGDFSIEKITPDHIEKIIYKMKDSGRAIATQKHVIKLVKHILNKAAEMEIWSGPDPCRSIKFPKLQNARLRFLSREVAEELLSALRLKSKKIAQIATISLYSGMRLGEVLALKWSDVDFTHEIITILDSKNGESRPIFITGPIKAVLEELTQGASSDQLFVTTDGSPVKTLSNTFGRVVDKIGLNNGITDRRQKVTFHTLRHTYASWAVKAGVPLFQVGKALGHKSTAMTERYSHLAPDSQRMVFEAVASHADELT